MNRRRTTFAIWLAGSVVLATPAAAGFLDQLFGGFIRRVQPRIERALPDMSPIPNDRVSPQGGDSEWRPRSEKGPRTAFCVRTCDGHYFPVHAHAGFSAAQMCNSFCPATETRLYAGGGIDYAVGPDGKRYADLPKAYAYRKQLVANCTCNGKDAFGLAHIDIKDDPTLQRGDLVATAKGLMAVTGKDANGPQLTAVQNYRGLSESARDRLADVKTGYGRHGTPRQTEGRAPADRD
jgi:hypothetical protein